MRLTQDSGFRQARSEQEAYGIVSVYRNSYTTLELSYE